VADAGVRSARPGDAPTLGELQARAWRSAYDGLLPPDALAGLHPAELAEAWSASLTAAPSARHRVLTAYAGAEVVGFAAFGPATDSDLDPARDAEVAALVVDAGHLRAGHGSRLLAATVEHLRDDGFTAAQTWVSPGDATLRDFLVGAGWAPDGATRSLDLRGDGQVVVEQTRLHTDVSPDAR
jgi:GNAT superfamily N-acetyltransferase